MLRWSSVWEGRDRLVSYLSRSGIEGWGWGRKSDVCI